MMAGFVGGIGGGFDTKLFGQLAGIGGQLLQSGAAASQAEAQAAAFSANAAVAELNAQAAIQQATESKRRQQRIAQQRLASKASGFLKSGVSLEGSPLAILGNEALQEALEAEDIEFQGQITAAQLRQQGGVQRLFARSSAQKAGSIQSQSIFRAGTTLLGSSLERF